MTKGRAPMRIAALPDRDGATDNPRRPRYF